MSAEVLQSLSSSMGSMVQPQSWTAVTGNPPAQHIPDSLCLSCLSASTSSSGDLLGVKSRPGLDALLHVSKSHGSDLLLLLLNGGKSPLLFSGAGEERDFSLPCSPLQRVSCSCLCCGCLAECVIDGLSAAVPL